jgi:Immunity protein 63
VTLAQVKAEIDRRAAVLGAEGNSLPSYGRTRDFGYPHIEIDSQGFHYIVVERGNELFRITTPDLDELLYHVFSDVTFDLACRYEVQRRVPGKDFRRLMFDRQIELLAKLSPAWAERRLKEQGQTLVDHPFVDR